MDLEGFTLYPFIHPGQITQCMAGPAEYTVLIGKHKPVIYAAAALAALANGASKVILKARGRAISRAVDVSQIVTKNSRLVIASVSIGSERLEKTGQKPVKVSTIEITMQPPIEINLEQSTERVRKTKKKAKEAG